LVTSEPWLLIDPKPVVGEAAFDASFLLLRNLEQDPTIRAPVALAGRLADSWRSTRFDFRVGTWFIALVVRAERIGPE
jgi:streptomycin 6-kinase